MHVNNYYSFSLIANYHGMFRYWYNLTIDGSLKCWIGLEDCSKKNYKLEFLGQEGVWVPNPFNWLTFTSLNWSKSNYAMKFFSNNANNAPPLCLRAYIPKEVGVKKAQVCILLRFRFILPISFSGQNNFTLFY